ncbi:50S ribosomal protein L21 [Tenacibaculum piscium]|uniref:Large ribosomal subunit protein bL21 n=2 Tax=Tenacibaculum piscium TaxID=1458515 RepID=A0A2H1YKU3_9FLAO|nr:50S ribosomal protein L21 [Tenacibaculum piscium]MBE7629351.1 50S ribosomal protein L21 [Tenacibaculum piscium]MCG8183196.1 50S ribosomal protein L21 [Tenacibaculum piscium]MCG8204620.1 50S ribosomal protein L21 [Tenacibaculum piscium]SOS75857.1 50S ribosomal protein L21 [Tenacibaculum piscium]
MYAIVEIAGQQFKVAQDQKVFVHRLQDAEGSNVTFENVMLIADKGNVTIGAPAITGAGVTAKVLRHLKGDKVIVFKKKRRKGYKKKNGHRQYLTEIQIESIVASGTSKAAAKAAPKKAAKKSTKADDLTKIEGAGPKAAEALVNAGIDTFAKVAKQDPATLSKILVEASSRLSHLVTTTWPKQAQLAADGEWDVLKVLQDKLDGGIEK